MVTVSPPADSSLPQEPESELAFREINAQTDQAPFVTVRSWRCKPGDFISHLQWIGELTYPLPRKKGVRALLSSLMQKPPTGGSPIVAPETGFLTWQLPEGTNIGAGGTLATYIPYRAWTDFDYLLQDHNRLFGEIAEEVWPDRAKSLIPTKTVDLKDLTAKLDATLAWAALDIELFRIRADPQRTADFLVGQLRSTISAACPVTPEDISPIYHRYFCLIQALDERLLAIDARYASRWLAAAQSSEAGSGAVTPAHSIPETAAGKYPVVEQKTKPEEIVRDWIATKDAAFRQILDIEEKNHKQPLP